MKKLTIYMLLTAGLVSGCKDDFLDRTPQDQISSATYWTSEKEALLALNGCYGVLGDDAGSAWYRDGFADNSYCQYPWESSAALISSGNIDANTNVGYDFGYIRRLNYFLTNIDKVTSIKETSKARYIAEARFLRAFNYFTLAQLFGPVPLLTEAMEEVTASQLTPVPENKVIEFLLAELAASAAALPEAYGGGTGNEGGRITKGAALAFKSRVHLFYSQWTEASTTAKQVMDMGKYNLFQITSLSESDRADDYSNLRTFANEAAKTTFLKGLRSYEKLFWQENEANSEIVLSKQFLQGTAGDNQSYINTFLLPSAVNGWSSITPTQELVNAYWNSDGTPATPPTAEVRAANYNNGTFKPAYLDEFKNRDTRLYATVLFPGSAMSALGNNYVFSWGRGGGNNSITGYNYRKLVDPTFPQEGQGAQDYPLIRYAEVLLNFAEAKNEATGPDATIYDALDAIRVRVAMPLVNRTLYASKDALRTLIRNERRIELAQEGFRYSDVRRWKIGTDVMKDTYDITNSLVQSRKWTDKLLRLPYPQSAVDRNPELAAAQGTKGY